MLVQDIEVLPGFIIVSVSKLSVHVYTLISTWLPKACEVALQTLSWHFGITVDIS